MSQDEVTVTGQFVAEVLPVNGLSALKVGDFIKNGPATPGNVAVCLSGGGSRAMTAGMGQLRALKFLKNDNGSLLGQTKAISTVSGGSWVGTTFQYINNSSVSDDDYLGTYVSPENLGKNNFQNLSEKSIGFRCTTNFSLLSLLKQAFLLWTGGVSPDMIWQTLIGQHIMGYYNLYSVNSGKKPNSYYTYDSETLKGIIAKNPKLAGETAYLIQAQADRVHRPYLVCNMAMFVNTRGTQFKYLVPVQATPFFTGIISRPAGVTDENGSTVGGGGVTSFGFHSDLLAAKEGSIPVTLGQTRQYALMDAVGTSSAAFAQKLMDLAAGYEDNLEKFIQDMEEHEVDVEKHIRPHISTQKTKEFDDFLDKFKRISLKGEALKIAGSIEHLLAKVGIDAEKDIKVALAGLKDLVPQYKYWPVQPLKVNLQVKPTHFADAGILENTAVAAMLAYSDIQNILSLVNTCTPMATARIGIIGRDGREIPDTRVQVDEQLPPLFGYQPYDKEKGYKLYEGDSNPASPIYKYNQVFESTAFAELLKGFKRNSGSGTQTVDNFGSNYLQTLKTVDNTWFGVKGSRTVKVLWVYNGNFATWTKLLSTDMKHLVADINGFPYYDTFFQLELNNQQVNALAHLTSWNIAENIAGDVLSLYKE